MNDSRQDAYHPSSPRSERDPDAQRGCVSVRGCSAVKVAGGIIPSTLPVLLLIRVYAALLFLFDVGHKKMRV